MPAAAARSIGDVRFAVTLRVTPAIVMSSVCVPVSAIDAANGALAITGTFRVGSVSGIGTTSCVDAVGVYVERGTRLRPMRTSPSRFTPTRRRPVIVTVRGGPTAATAVATDGTIMIGTLLEMALRAGTSGSAMTRRTAMA